MLIGVIGKSGAGKSSLIEKIARLDRSIIHIDIDKVWAEVIQDKSVIDNVVKIACDSSILTNGKLDRYKTGNIIFSDKNKYEQYYSYIEGIIYSVIDKIIIENSDKKIFLDWIILDKTKYWSNLDYKILVDTDYECRKNRVIEREKISEEYFDLREMMKDDYSLENIDLMVKGNNIEDKLIKEILGEINGKE